jgi:hypothetical protein
VRNKSTSIKTISVNRNEKIRGEGKLENRQILEIIFSDSVIKKIYFVARIGAKLTE